MNNPEAIAMIREQLNLNDEPSSWSYEQRFKYNQTLAAYEAANPGLFPASSVVALNNITNKDFDPLVDDSFSFSAFGDEMLNQANVKLNSFGVTIKQLLFVAVIILVAVFAWRKVGK